jgi:hypothetical protein
MGELDAESPTEAFRESSRLVCPRGLTRTLAGNGSRRETIPARSAAPVRRLVRRFTVPNGAAGSSLSFARIIKYGCDVTVELVSNRPTRLMDFVDNGIAFILPNHHPPSLPVCRLLEWEVPDH